MSGRTKNYKKYLDSVDKLKEPIVRKAKLDMRGALMYASNKGIKVGDLSKQEKDMFITYL